MKLLRLFTSAGSIGLIKGQYGYLKAHGIDITVATGAQAISDRSLAPLGNVPHRLIPHLVRSISIWNDIRALIELIQLIRKEKPDIVHANTPKASLLGMMAAWVCRVPHRIYTVTGLRFETTTGFMRWLLKTMERITCFCASKVVPEGEGVKKTLQREHITHKPMQVLHNGNINGIDLGHYMRTEQMIKLASEIREKVGGDFTFLFVGRIVRDKGIVELVDAFAKIQKEYPAAKLVLVGCQEPKLDPLPEATQQLIHNCDAIIEAGWQDDVRPWFVASDLFTFPSYREGFPNVVIQAGALGIPSIVTDINGSNEIIIEGENGVIIPKQDTDALYEKMLWALNNRVALAKMSANCRSLVASRYRQEEVWQATLEMYQNLTSQTNS